MMTSKEVSPGGDTDKELELKLNILRFFSPKEIELK